MKTVYLFDDSGVYISEYIAQESPLEAGVFIVPENSTEIAPPAGQINKAPLFKNGEWVFIDDFRGQIIYDQSTGAGTEVIDVGPMPDGFALTEPVKPQPTARDIAKAERTAAVEAIKVTTQAGNTFDGDETSQGRMARAIVALEATGVPTVTWVLADNTVIQATQAELTEALVLAGQAQAAIWVI